MERQPFPKTTLVPFARAANMWDSPRNGRLSRTAAAIAIALSVPAANAIENLPMPSPANTIVVENCDDSGTGSLRDAVASAASGDMVDLSQLTCSTITLTSGAIEIPQDDLYLKYSGEGGTPPTIDGSDSSRVFHHAGTGTLKLVGLTITHGKYDNTNAPYAVSASGGCIYSRGSVYLGASTVTGCTARDTLGQDASGGGIYVDQVLTLHYSIVSANTATSTVRFGDGGGAFAFGAVNAYYSSISGNVAAGLGYLNFGGGIELVSLSNSPSVISNSTISGNTADRGSGLMIAGGGTGSAAVTITNSTISGNTANVYSAAYLRGPVTLIASTVAFNTSPSGPCIELASDTDPVQIESSILADNGNGNVEYDIGSRGYPITIAGSHDLIIETSASLTLPLDTISADPLLLPLADNGGPTTTHALGAGSPAIDAGDNVDALAFDQRGNGYPRVSGAAADIGAFERTAGDTIFADGFDGG
jgi:hypothetical protein